MSNIAIKVENLGKKYIINHEMSRKEIKSKFNEIVAFADVI